MDLTTRSTGWLLAAFCLAVSTGCGSDDAASVSPSDTTEAVAEQASASEGEDVPGDDSDEPAGDEPAGDGEHDDEGGDLDSADSDHADDDEGEDGDHDDEDGDHDEDEDGDHDEDEDGDHDDEDGDHEDEDGDHEDEDGDHDDHDDGAASGLGAHEHGAGELTVAWAGSDMVVDLISPTFNIFGFENEPDTDEEIALVDDRLAALSEPGVFSVNETAGCSVVGDVTTNVEFEGSHAELTASWALECDNPDEIEQLDAAGLFAVLENLEDLDVEWASDSGQSSAELTPSATDLSLTE